MRPAEAVAAVRGIVDEYRAKPQAHLSGHVVIVLKRKGRPPGGERVRVLPGVLGRFLCMNADGGIVVDLEVAKLEGWLEKEAHRGA